MEYYQFLKSVAYLFFTVLLVNLFCWYFYLFIYFLFQLWNDHCSGDNQVKIKLPAFKKNAADLLKVPVGQVSLSALEHNIAVATLFIEAWLRRKFFLMLYFAAKRIYKSNRFL